MNKKEYLNELKSKLSSMNPEESKKHIRSYRIKINTLINQGMSESEALKKLGSVEKVAKDILKGKEKKIKPVKTTKTKSSSKNLKSKTIKTAKTKTSAKSTKVKKEEKVKEAKQEKKNVKESKNENKKSIKEKLNDLKKKRSENKKTEKVKTEIVEEPTEVVEETIENILEEEISSVKEEKTQEDMELNSMKPVNVVIKQMTNLICLLLCVALMYFPFNLVNIYGIRTLGYFLADIGYVYAFSLIVNLFYLVFCLAAFTYYLDFIMNNKKMHKINIATLKVKKICLYLLVVPMMLLVVLGTMAFLMSCFFFLDGLRIKGMPIAFFGLLIFVCMLYTTLRNKILGKEKSIFYSFFLYLIPLLIMGTGLGMVYKDTKLYEVSYNVDEKYQMKNTEYEYSLPDKEKFKITFNTNYHTLVDLKEDKKLAAGKVRITMVYYKDYYEVKTKHDNVSTYISMGASPRRKLSMFLENIKENKIYALSELERYEVTIYYNPKDKDRFVIEN